jgi:capsular exopolysaccharide synthesis family protein
VASRRYEPLHRHLIDRPRSAYAESVQAIYTQVRRSAGAPGVALITSALPGDGKTSLAVSLATCAAQLGEKTLLIDLDLRRPAVAWQFRLEPETDLLDVLEGRTSAANVICRDPDSGLHVLAAAGHHENPIALLRSERLEEMLREVSGRYDYVVLDAPPVLGVPDAKELAGHADAVLFVVRWGCKRDAAIAALKELAGVSAEVTGVILTQVDSKRHASYGYGDAGQFYHKYRKYYVS